MNHPQAIVIATTERCEDYTAHVTTTLYEVDDHFYIREVVEPEDQEDAWLTDSSTTEREVTSHEAVEFAQSVGLSFDEAARAVMLGPDDHVRSF